MNYIKLTKTFMLLLTFTIMMSACAEKKLNIPSVKNIKDINLKISKDGDITLNKSHVYKDGNKTTEQTIISENNSSKNYEIVPDFNKKDIKDITIKEDKAVKKAKIKIYGNKVKISVEDIPVNEFIDLVFSNVLKLNYTTSKEVSKMDSPITLSMSKEQSKQEVFEVVSKLLSFEGIGIKKDKGVFFISIQGSPQIQNSISGIYIGYGTTVNSSISDNEKIIQLVPYEYILPNEALKFIDFAGISTSHVSYVFLGRNFAMLKGKASDVKKAIKIIELVDRPSIRDKTTYLITLKDIDVEVFLERITDIFKANGISIGVTPKELGITLTAIPESNSLLAISPKKNWIDMLLYWKRKLDVQSEITHEPKFYIYKVKNRKADKLAKVLNAILNLKKTKRTSSKNKKLKIKKSRLSNQVSRKRRRVSSGTIQADLDTNILMMQLLPSEYRELLPLIETLDVLPLQVLAEVTLAEVTLTDNFNLGFEHAIRNNDSGKGLTNLSTLVSTLGGNGFAATYNSKEIDITVNALAQNKLLSILSKPKILILNNQTGSINVGQQIPVITSEASATDLTAGNTPSVLRNVKYRSTGVTVGLTPTINSNGILTMAVNLQLSEAQLNDTSRIDSPLIVNRSLSTNLILKNGETVLLGGLISKNKSTSDGGVPILMDIPWLGNIFKTQSETFVKTELIILIKPSIISAPMEMTEKTKKYRSMLRLLDKYSLF